MDNAQMKPDKENEFLLHFYETIIARIKSDKRTTRVREGGGGGFAISIAILHT